MEEQEEVEPEVEAAVGHLPGLVFRLMRYHLR